MPIRKNKKMVQLPKNVNRALNRVMPPSIVRARETLLNYEESLNKEIESVRSKIVLLFRSINQLLISEVEKASERDCVIYVRKQPSNAQLEEKDFDSYILNKGMNLHYTRHYGKGQKKRIETFVRFSSDSVVTLLENCRNDIAKLNKKIAPSLEKLNLLKFRLQGEEPPKMEQLEKIWI